MHSLISSSAIASKTSFMRARYQIECAAYHVGNCGNRNVGFFIISFSLAIFFSLL